MAARRAGGARRGGGRARARRSGRASAASPPRWSPPSAPERVDRLVLACTSPGGADSFPLPEGTLRADGRGAVARRPRSRCAASSRTRSRRTRHRRSSTRSSPTARRTRPTRPDGRLRPPPARRGTRTAAANGSPRRRSSSRARPTRSSTRVTRSSSPSAIPERAARSDRGRRPLPVLGAARRVHGPRRGAPRMSLFTIDRILRDRARATPGRVASVSDWTYADLDRRSDEIAARLERGSRVSTLTGNSPEHVAVFFACAKAGAILHPISWRLAPAEIAYQLDDAEPAVLPRRGRAPRARRRRRSPSRAVTPPLELPGAAAAGRARRTRIRSSSSTRAAPPASRRARCSPTRTASGRASPSTSQPGSPATTSCSRCSRSSTSAAGTSSPCSRGGRAPASCSSAASTPSGRSS